MRETVETDGKTEVPGFLNADAPEYSEMSAYSLNDSNPFAHCGNNWMRYEHCICWIYCRYAKKGKEKAKERNRSNAHAIYHREKQPVGILFPCGALKNTGKKRPITGFDTGYHVIS